MKSVGLAMAQELDWNQSCGVLYSRDIFNCNVISICLLIESYQSVNTTFLWVLMCYFLFRVAFSVPNLNVCPSLISCSYFPWLLCASRTKCDISGTPRHAVVLAGSLANAQSHHAVWLRLPLQFKTDALHQHWQLRRAWGRQLFWVN